VPVVPPLDAPDVPDVPKLEPVGEAEPRESTPEQQAAAEAQKAKDDQVAAADAQREEAEKARMAEDEERVAETERIRQEGLDAAKAAAESVAAGGSAAEAVPGAKIVAGLPRGRSSLASKESKGSALVAGADPASCKATSGTVAETNWCKTGCANEPPNCPAEVCECEGGLPVPSPLAAAAVVVAPPHVDERPMTKAEKEAEKAVAERDALSAAADAARVKEDAQRVTQQQERVAALTPDASAQELPALDEHGQPAVTPEGTAAARPLSQQQQASQKALDERDAIVAAANKEREEAEARKLEQQEKQRLVIETSQRKAEQQALPSPSPDAEEGPAE
jgi:hypothetical protein